MYLTNNFDEQKKIVLYILRNPDYCFSNVKIPPDYCVYKADVENAFKKMTKEEKNILYTLYTQNRTVREAAKVLNKSPAYVCLKANAAIDKIVNMCL